MWCYQKPGFDALLLAGLQRQQQCSQFCDTMLKAGGVSVPAHSCILSAISPHISSALSSSPTPPSGLSRLLEFQALGACTLLHMVRLLYSGEMAGEGENEKQEAIYAAAKLGITGLVEVTKSRGRLGGQMEQHAEVGVQTEPMGMEEDDGRVVRWRREVRDGFTCLWKETLSDGGRDMWTQMEEQLVDSCAPVSSMAPYETIDMSVLQSLGHTDSHQVVPVTIVYPPDENQYSCGPPHCLQESTRSGSTSVAIVAPQYAPVPPPLPLFPTQTASFVADFQSCWADTNPDEGEVERLEQFEGNIAGFINYFLNPEKREGPRRGRAGRRPRGARAAGTRQQRTRRPRGRGRGGFTQMVDVQEIGVSKLQKVFLHRWGVSTPRTGQGGGAVGRRLYQRTREELEPSRKGQSRRRRGKVFEVGLSQDVQRGSGGGVANRGRRKTTQQVTEASLSVGRDQYCRNQPAPDYYCVPSKNVYSGPSLASSSPSLRQMLSPAAQRVSPASSLPHSPLFAPPAPPPPEDQPEYIDRLLDEVIKELNILPSNKATHSQCPPPTSRDMSGTSGNFSIQNKQHAQISSSAVPVLQQRCEGELNDMLENFLQSFEQHVDSSNTRKENETHESSPEASEPDSALRKHRTAEIHGDTPHTPGLRCQANRSQTPGVQSDDGGSSDNRLQMQEASLRQGVPSEELTETKRSTVTSTSRPKRRKANTDLFSLEKRKVWDKNRGKKTTSSQDPKAGSAQDRKEQLPQRTPVGKLDRNNLLSVRATLQGLNCENPEGKSPSEAKKCSHYGLLGKNGVRKSYPIRSRYREAQIQDLTPFLEQNLVEIADCPKRNGRGRSRKNGNLLGSSRVESTTAPAQPTSMGLCSTNDQTDKNPLGHEEDLTVQSPEEVEGPTERGLKRGAESMNETGDEDLVDKKICLDEKTTEAFIPSSKSADFPSAAATLEPIEVIDVETVSLSSLTDFLQEIKQEEKPISEAEDSLSDKDTEIIDEIIDVEEYQEDSAETVWHKDGHLPEKRRSASPSHADKVFSLEWTGKYEKDIEEEDIDVTGGSIPSPGPVMISWTESSESEEEVDVVGEMMDGWRYFL